MRKLPDELRETLKEPIGRLVGEEELLRLLAGEKYIVSVGDQVTYTLLTHHIEPIFCVVDFKVKRSSYAGDMRNMIKSFGDKVMVVKNPPACISDDLWHAIEAAYRHLEKGSMRIEVDGEEDLATLPAVFLAPRDVTIIYGLPNKGVVIVKALEKYKQKVKEILDKM